MPIVISPLRVSVTKKKFFILNLNNYPNTHYQTLNKAKKTYKEVIRPQIMALPAYDVIHTTYTLFPKTRRLTDLDNVCCVHAKFFQDALVFYGNIQDDNYMYVSGVNFRFGEVCKDNPRVEIEIRRVVQ